MSNVCRICGKELPAGLIVVGLDTCLACRGGPSPGGSSSSSSGQSEQVRNFLRRANNGQC